jgi:pyruvate/2-oxoglutarate dehydrogenase complex dihydrolipoamide acyltransferase (E2) component
VQSHLVRLVLPDDGPGHGTVSKWHVALGTAVGRDELLVEVETDKANVELRAPGAGVVLEIFHPEGATVGRDGVLAVIGEAGADARALLTALGGDDRLVKSVGLRVRGECPECGARIAINGPHVSVPCMECGTTSPLSTELWSAILDAVARGEDFTRIVADPWSLTVRVVRGEPACHNCDHALAPGDAPEGESAIACGACGLSHRRTAPPSWMRARFPWITALLGVLEAAPLRDTTSPVACPSCGARQAKLDAGSPIPRCAYCGMDVRPPGSGAALPRRWYLVR